MMLYTSGLHTRKLSQLAFLCITTMYLTDFVLNEERDTVETEFKIAVLTD